MARRWSSRGASFHKKSKRSNRFSCEWLEPRTLFVVLHGGDVFEFFAENSFYERVAVTGNTTVELIGGRVDPTAASVATQFSLDPMHGVVTQGPDMGMVNGGFSNVTPPGGMTPPTFVDTIYAMYVSHSDVNSRIAVAMVPDLMASPRPMQPFTGSVGTLRVIPAAIANITPGAPMFTVAAPDGTGMALLGARTVTPMPPMGGAAPMNVDNVPILTAPVPAGMFTTLPPQPNNMLAPGLIVAPGNDLGAFLFGGTITGQVDAHGSIDQFYAGWVLTGNAKGEEDIGIVSFPHNFNVAGDLRNLIVRGPIGTESDTRLGRPDYVTGFDLHVGGRLGQINTQDSLIGNVDVTNSPSAPTIAGTPEREIEFRGIPPFDPWDAPLLMLGGDAVPFLNNDTFDTPQYLGPTDNSGNAVVNGIIQADPAIPGPDFVDYYAVPLMAGQTVTVQATETPYVLPDGTVIPAANVGIDVGVFDPDQRLIATDYNRTRSATQEQPFQFTADRPGVYRFAVTESQNTNFDALPPGARLFAVIPYTLLLSGLGNLAVGGIVAAGNIFDNPSGLPVVTGTRVGGQLDGFHVANGDFGAAVAAGQVISDDAAGTGTFPPGGSTGIFTFAVDNGSLRAVEGAQIGDLFGFAGDSFGAATVATGAGGTRTNITSSAAAGTTFRYWPTAAVPHGSVGLLKATLAGNGTGILAWNVLLPDGAQLPTGQASQFAIGGDYELVDAASLFVGDLIANGNIGTIRAFSMATSPASYLQVNASFNPNVHATIDLIDVRTFLGDLSDGGPGITTGPGGDVRYIHIGQFGVAYRDIFFGGGTPDITLYQPGETANITDDSGTIVHITPVGGQLASGTNPANPTFSNPAELFITTYPIRGSGGAVIVEVESSDEVSITADGTGPNQTAEIGKIVLDGPGAAVVNNNTIQAGNNAGAAGGAGGGGGGTGTGTGAAIRRHGHARPARAHRLVRPARVHRHAPVLRRNGRARVFPGPGQPGGAPPAGGATGTVGAPGGLPAPVNKQPFKPPTLPTPPSLPGSARALTVTFGGTVKLDTYEITSAVDPTGATSGLDESLLAGEGFVTSITNNTPGEIVNIHLSSVGTLTTNGTIGLAETHTASAVLGLPRNPLMEDSSHGQLGNPWDYPFLRPTSMIRVLGNIVSINARRGIANVYAGFVEHQPAADFTTVNQLPFVGTPEDPAGGSPIAIGVGGNIGSVVGAIQGPVVAAGSLGSVTAQGGIGPNGSGAVGGDGLYAVGVIGPVVSNGDFRGTSVSRTGQLSLSVNGVMSGAIVASFTRFDFAEARSGGAEVPGTFPNPITFPAVDIGSVAVNGNGGIIGSVITGDHIGTITVSDSGFGIFGSVINIAVGEGTLSSLTTGGYGIRDSTIVGGASIGPINVHGNGSTLPTTGFPASVRQSETGAQFDPATGIPISPLNDIDTYLGTVTGAHQTPGTSDTGVIEATTILGSRDLSSVSAWSIRGRNLNLGATNPSTFNVANKIGLVNVAGPVRGLNLVTGRGFRYRFGGDVAELNMTVAGPIQKLVFNNSLLSDSFINASGPNGRIGSLTIHGNLDGGVRATQKIGRVQVDGNLVGNISGPYLNMLKLGGGIGNGSLTINTSVGTIQTVGDFGVAGSSLTINGSLGTLKVGGNLNGMLTVLHNLRNMTVNGSILTGAKVAIGGTLSLLKVGGDVQARATVHAQIIKKQVIKGRVLGTIIAP